MKKLILLLAILVLPFGVFAQQNSTENTLPSLPQSQNGKPDVYVFTSPTCGHCMHFRQEFYPKLIKEFKDEVNFIEVDTSDGKGSLQLRNLAMKYGLEHYGVPCLIVGKKCLIGYPSEIKEEAQNAIKTAIKENLKTKEIEDVNAKEAFSKFTLAMIIINGLIDGINPCAFAVIVFLISFLTIYHYDRREVILIGSSYCLAVFITYILLGLGLFNALYALRGFQTFNKYFYIVTASICIILFLLSIYDFLVYLRTKNSKEMLLTLSTNLKIRINKIIGFFLRGKKHSTVGLVLASFAVGFSVSLVEAVCTGQVYVPTIVAILKDPTLRIKAWLYLLMYNVMFILPLLSVFILCAVGIKSEGINNFFKKHLAIAKLCLSLVFLGLAIMLLLNI